MNQLSNLAAVVIAVYILLAQSDGASTKINVQQHSIETRVIVDKLAISRWKNNFTSRADPETKRLADSKLQMTTYIQSVFVGVNAIYRGLLGYGIKVDARIISIEFVTDETISTDVYNGTRVNSNKVLQTFQVWLQKKGFNQADHFLLFTGWDLSDGTRSSITGVAKTGRMCQGISSVSAVEIRSAIGGAVQSLAHELGHSLGAKHDGDSNPCPVDSAMIMDFNGGANSSKNFQFSRCSAFYIKQFLEKLPDSNCLSPANTATPEVQGRPLGQLYDPDTVCRMSIGPHSHFGRSFYGPSRLDYATICTAIWCWTGGNYYHSVDRTDGFTCGSGKMCVLGQCVRSSAVATTVSDTCPFGDVPSDVDVHNNKSCHELITEKDQSYCYGRFIRTSCCASCEAARTNDAACMYGDTDRWCATEKYPYTCNWNNASCCASCKKYETSTPGCKYGDKYKECSTLRYPLDCYKNEDDCCSSCKTYVTNDPACKYGDKDISCASASYPYTCSRNNATCCGSCKKYGMSTLKKGLLTEKGPSNIQEQLSIETRVIVDKLAIRRWKNNFTSPADPDSKRLSDTLSQMTTYIKSVFVGVNAIYRGLVSSGIKLDVRIINIEFVPEETISTHVYDGTRVNSDKVLETFKVWLQKKGYRNADHFLLFTGWDLSNGTSSSVTGVAYTGRMCQGIRSVSAVEIRSAIGGAVQTLAHELGHSLGAQHDGKSNPCPVDSAMIMDFNGGANSSKNFQFSQCSIHYITKFLEKLADSRNGNCLSPANTAEPEVQGKPLGQLYDPDTVCRMSIGPHSYFGRAFYGPSRQDYATICTAIFCWTGGNHYHSVDGTDGFTCGSGKVCDLGHCVSSSAVSTAVPDTCPFGDVPSDVDVHRNKSCHELITQKDQHYCYDSFTRTSCCASCEAARRNDAECVYGDKAPGCATENYPYTCNWNNATCCASCKQYETSIPECVYGDTAPWCATENYPYTCNWNNATCCASCKQYETSIPGCKYGDKHSWCKTIPYPSVCRRNADNCCATCQ